MPNPVPNPNATSTTFQVGTYAATTDSFTSVLDLNDGATFFILNGSLQLPQPAKVAVSSFNVRTPGEAVVRYQYKNRHIKVGLTIRGASTTALMASVRSLLAAVEHPPYTIRLALPGATAYTFADVRHVAHTIPADPLRILQKAIVKVELDFECAPFLRGDRLYLSNLVVNPGFESPIGGAQAPAVQAFADAFATVNAYAVQAGGAPTVNPARTYVDIVLTDGPLRLYMLSEASGTGAYEVASGQGYTGTLGGSGTTVGSVGGISGDSSTAYALNGSGYVTIPTTGLPTGNAPWAIEVLFKMPAANPAANMILMSFGSQAVNNGGPQIYVNTSGQPAAAHVIGPDAVGTALALSAWHHLVAMWDGTHLTIWQDNVNSGTSTPTAGVTPNPPTYGVIGGSAAAAPANLTTGSIQAVAIYTASSGYPLSSTQIGNHYNAFKTGATGTVANAMSLPSAGRVAFGSPAWGAMQTWQTRFRYVSGLTASCYLHYTDANNHLRVDVASGTNATKLVHTIAGVATTVAQASPTLVHEAWYWLQCTQYPAMLAITPPYLSATLSYDQAGAVGAAVVATLAGAAQDAATAEVGRPQLLATGAALAVGGLASGLGNAVSLFGPGGWTFQGAGAAGPCSGAWDGDSHLAGTSGNGGIGATYPGGPVTSFGAARVDLAPAGAVDAKWRLYTGGAPAGTWAMPVKAGSDVILMSAYVKSSGLGVAATIKLEATEYNSSGTLVAGPTVLQTLTGNQASWTQLAGSLTTQASTAYVDLAVHVADTNAGASANGTVWVDNCQCWDQTACNGQASMPYCELRFPNGPAQLMVSGLAGDVATNAQLSLGTYLASWPAGSLLTLLCGRRAQGQPPASTVSAMLVASVSAVNPGGMTPGLDATAYGGYVWQSASNAATASGFWLPAQPVTYPGVYHLVSRARTSQAAGNLANVQARIYAQGGISSGTSNQYVMKTAYAQAFAASATWTYVDHGQLAIPLTPLGDTTDPGQQYAQITTSWQDTTAGGSQLTAGAPFLLPIDASVLSATIYNGSGNALTAAPTWLWAYADGLGLMRTGAAAAWGFSTEPQALARPDHLIAGVGTAAGSSIGTSPVADPAMTLDPTLASASGASSSTGVNLLAALLTDGAGTVLPLFAEIQYAPSYLYPR